MAMQEHALVLYRSGTLGETLKDSLQEMVDLDRIDSETALKILQQFDKSINMCLRELNDGRTSVSGGLQTYRNCDNVWTMHVENANFRLKDQIIHCDKVKIVACEGRARNN